MHGIGLSRMTSLVRLRWIVRPHPTTFVRACKQMIHLKCSSRKASLEKQPMVNTTTLGRGGSDYTASLIASAIDAACLEKSTDVPGMLTADPRMVPEAQVIAEMSYEEAMELCHFGAKVIYHPTIAPLREKGIPLIVRSTFNSEAPGTRIVVQSCRSSHRPGPLQRGRNCADDVGRRIIDRTSWIFESHLFCVGSSGSQRYADHPKLVGE